MLIKNKGLGDSAEGFEDFFDSSSSPCLPTTKVVLLTAPIKPVTINFGMKMPSWYFYIINYLFHFSTYIHKK